MEINVGEYVRTNLGIGTVHRIYNDIGGYYVRFSKKVIKKWVTITKHSKDIIDLIEVGDYVNGYQVIEKPYIYHDIQFVSVDTQDSWSWGKGEMPVENIKSIVTKEQFEVNAYTIEKEG